MSDARRYSDWTRTSSILAMIANVNRDHKKTNAFKPSDFNPFDKKRDERLPGGMKVLKSMFVKGDD